MYACKIAEPASIHLESGGVTSRQKEEESVPSKKKEKKWDFSAVPPGGPKYKIKARIGRTGGSKIW